MGFVQNDSPELKFMEDAPRAPLCVPPDFLLCSGHAGLAAGFPGAGVAVADCAVAGDYDVVFTEGGDGGEAVLAVVDVDAEVAGFGVEG